MKNRMNACLIAVCMAMSTGAAFAQQPKADIGKQEYEANCASCHGLSGKGDGPMAGQLRTSPTDLTQLAKKNRGVLPVSRLYEVIEGKNVPSHGSREMPVWGREFQIENAEFYKEARGSYDAAALVRARILMLLEYIDRIQAR
ncbi:MAG TPA: cytochrome c [Noviherbaspirillum sp.]|uniref:c-type cytochrome n=1 Tax=Noviherbaspirillum sp. TaxID=1926288 RepID=UPI002B4A9C25|nr:cytochrome c [Noviherbaspirillum sp.]HJV85997.1 cytochrome c [Noviherbaspirillum sp.]